MTPQPGMQASIVKTTLKGEIVWSIQAPAGHRRLQAGRGRPAAARYNPTNLAIAPNGDVYVADGYGSFYINQYNAKGEYLRTFGGRGSEPGKLLEPHGIWIDTRGAHRSSSSPIAATTGCSASRSTASTSTSSPASGCRATSTSARGSSSFPICTAA